MVSVTENMTEIAVVFEDNIYNELNGFGML